MLQRIAKVNTRVEMGQITLEIEEMKTRAKDIIKHFEHSFITRLNQCQDQAKQSNMKYLESIKYGIYLNFTKTKPDLSNFDWPLNF